MDPFEELVGAVMDYASKRRLETGYSHTIRVAEQRGDQIAMGRPLGYWQERLTQAKANRDRAEAKVLACAAATLEARAEV